MKLSRIDYIALNGGTGEHYDMDILERLKLQPKTNGAYLKDIEDAIKEIEKLRQDVKVLNGALTITSEGNARIYSELAELKAKDRA